MSCRILAALAILYFVAGCATVDVWTVKDTYTIPACSFGQGVYGGESYAHDRPTTHWAHIEGVDQKGKTRHKLAQMIAPDAMQPGDVIADLAKYHKSVQAEFQREYDWQLRMPRTVDW